VEGGVELSQTLLFKLLNWSGVYGIEFIEESYFSQGGALPNGP
jgi:hypothetical protein